jgi:menaquinone-dependent protoporphyrinogen IX oxidase
MKIIIMYASWFGNGKKVVDELAEVLKSGSCGDNQVEIFDMLAGGQLKESQADLYIFSSPTRKFALPPEVKNFITELNIPSGKSYALVTTYLDPRTIALRKMEELLNGKGMVKAAESLKVRARSLKGPLEEGYNNRLEEFAKTVTGSK